MTKKDRTDAHPSMTALTFVPRLKFVYALAATAAAISASVAFGLKGAVRRKYEVFVPERVMAQMAQNSRMTSKRRPTTMQLKMARPRLSGVVKART